MENRRNNHVASYNSKVLNVLEDSGSIVGVLSSYVVIIMGFDFNLENTTELLRATYAGIKRSIA